MVINLKSKKKILKSSINTKIWSYLVLFSFLILMLLWGFQVLFLSSYYEWRTTKNMKQIVSKLIISYRKNNGTDSFYESLENLSFENGICIIEWGELIKDALPKDYIHITFEKDDSNENYRKLEVETFGNKYQNLF